jgi:membrane protease YdiL (CAAX protease family)
MLFVQSPIVGWIAPGNTFLALLHGEFVFWGLTAIVLAYVCFVERRPLASIGLRAPTWKTPLYGLVAAVVAVGGALVLYAYVFPAFGLRANVEQLGSIQKTPLWFQWMLLLRAPVFEEVFYRGFVIERLSEIIHVRWVAAFISLGAFTYAHLSYWGWETLITVAFQGAVLTGLYLWRRDLGANMIAHLLTDAVAFFAF